MGYSIQMLSELDGVALASGAEVIDKYISTKNCTGLLIGVKSQENGGTIQTLANIFTKMGTLEVVVSNQNGGGSQVSIDWDDIPSYTERIMHPGLQSHITGTQADDNWVFASFFIPLSPDPYSPKFGYRDARIKLLTSGTQTASDNYSVYAAALLHDQAPEYYVQMIQNAYTTSSGVNKDFDLPEGQLLMGVHAFGTTSLGDLTATDAPTIDQFALVVDNSERERINARALAALQPRGFYNLTATPTTASADYLFWDLGFKKGFGIPIARNWKLRVKTLASDAARIYPLIAFRERQS